MTAKGLLISGAKGPAFESRRAHHTSEVIQQDSATSKKSLEVQSPSKRKALDDSDSLVTRASKRYTNSLIRTFSAPVPATPAQIVEQTKPAAVRPDSAGTCGDLPRRTSPTQPATFSQAWRAAFPTLPRLVSDQSTVRWPQNRQDNALAELIPTLPSQEAA